jgi:hypothetical protein
LGVVEVKGFLFLRLSMERSGRKNGDIGKGNKVIHIIFCFLLLIMAAQAVFG